MRVTSDWQISVIIPVYNAEPFIQHAVESALDQLETTEIILVEDCSTDNSLAECEKMSSKYSKVKILRHPRGINRGAGASRNLGITHSRSDYIAFLDADDYYLPHRFIEAKRLFCEDPSIDGVYEAVGNLFENEAAKELWISVNTNREPPRLTATRYRVPPEELFEKQSPVGNDGYCHLDGWVVKKTIFEHSGLFDTQLLLHQDTALIVKFAAVGTMVAGRIDEPVAIRRLHGANRITAPRSEDESYNARLLMWRTLWDWGKNKLTFDRRQKLFLKYLHFAMKPKQPSPGISLKAAISFRQLTSLIRSDPSLLKEYNCWYSLVKYWITYYGREIIE